MSLRHSLAGVTLALTALTACSSDTVYSHYQSLADDGWFKSDTLGFDIPPIQTTGEYAATVCLRTTARYPYANLTLVMHVHNLLNGQYCSDTLQLQLADTTGHILGPGVSIYQYELPPASLKLAESDSIRICVSHDMQREWLPGITDVGITLKRRQP